MGVFKSNQLITAASVIGKLFIPHVSNHANFLESDTPESFFSAFKFSSFDFTLCLLAC